MGMFKKDFILEKTNIRRKNGNLRLSFLDSILKTDGLEYAKLTKIFGDSKFESLDVQEYSRISIIRGKIKKKYWFKLRDVVLLSFENNSHKANILHKFSLDQVIKLKKMKELPLDFNNSTICIINNENIY